MKKVLKIFIAVVLCIVMTLNSKAFASYNLVRVENLGGVWAYHWNSYIRRPSNTELFHLNNGSEERLAFCVQKLVHTSQGVVYDDPLVIDSGTVLSSYSYMPMVSILAGVPGNTVDNYWNNLLNAEVKRSLNIAYVWWRTYCPDDLAGASAVACFYWSQSIGAAGKYMEDHLDRTIFAGPTGPAPTGLTDGYRYYQFKTYAQAEAERTAFYEGMFNPDMVERSNARLRELIAYYEAFDYTMPELVCTSDVKTLHPGQSVTWTDTKGKIANTTEWTLDTSALPAGVSVSRNGNNVIFTASNDYVGTNDFSFTLTRFKNSNNGGYSRMYGNASGNQILYEGALPARSVSYTQKATSIKLQLAKHGNDPRPQGDADLNNAQYRIWNAEGTVNENATLTRGDNGAVTYTTDWIEPGTYYAKETIAPTGYNLSDETYEFVLTAADSNNVVNTRDVYETVKENNVVIHKQVGATSNTEQQPLDQCEFTATLISDRSVQFVSEATDMGVYTIKDLPYGTYEIEETVTSPIALTADKFTIFVEKDRTERDAYTVADATFETENLAQDPTRTKWTDVENNLVDIPKVMVINMHKVDFDKDDSDDKTYMQGDANLEGAIYEIYRYDPMTDDYTEYVYDITVDHIDDGYWTATSDELAVGKYMVKEKIKSSETVDGVTYDYSYAEGYLSDPETYYFDQNPAEQTVRLTTHELTSKEKVIRGAIYVEKFDEDRSNVDPENDSDKVPSAGAILRLTLNSNPEIYYTVKLDDNGYGEFIETNDEAHTSTAVHDSKAAYYPYTIPYGEYTITEDKEADGGENTSFYIQPEEVTIAKQAQKEYRIEADVAVPTWVKITKKDNTTGDIIPLAGSKYKIWDVDNERFVSMKVGVGTYVEEFATNAEGYFYTPQKLNPGNYVLYEVQAPEGYYLQDDWRLPDNASDIGDATKGGKAFTLSKVGTGLTIDATNPGEVGTGELEYNVDIKDNPLYVNIKLIKTSERITNAQQSTVSYTKTNGEEVELEKTVPVYTDGIGLEGVSYKIYANEDIYTPDGVLRTANGTLVDDVTTDSEGIAQSRMDLFPGKYKVVEYAVPDGYLLDPEPKYITVENNDQYVESATGTLELSDVRQRLGYKFKKIFEQYKYATGGEGKHAVFGIYSKTPIYSYTNEVVIEPDTLVDMLEVDGDNFVETTTDLPDGDYYVKELYVSFPYALSTDIVEFTLAYNGDGVTPKITVEGQEIVNAPDTGYAKFIKLSKSIDDGLIINGSEYQADGLDEKAAQILEEVKNMTRDDILTYFENSGVKFVEGAEYEIWLDEQGTNKLQEVNLQTGDMKVATFTTDNIGVLELFELPKGAFYLKETKAPQGYEIQNDVVPFEITSASPEATIYQAIFDESVLVTGLHKTDIYTGENVPNCKFEIRDEDGNLLMYSITDEEGFGYIPQDMFEEGKTYTYTEIEAPDVYKEDGRLYELNTEPHEFVAHYDEDGNWAAEKLEVENYRPTTNVKLIKTDDESNLVPNCKFELKSEEEGLFYETGITNEKGIYVFENVPQGWYTYTELDAPEGYDIDKTPHRIYVTGEEIIIDFVDAKVDTGDIPVIALAVLGVICVAGIAFVVVRKVKSSKKA